MAVTTPFATVEEAIEDIREGRLVVVVDDPDRENEGDLVVAAQFATPETINFMATHARGLVCLCLTEERADYLGLRPMTDHNEAPLGTALTEGQLGLLWKLSPAPLLCFDGDAAGQKAAIRAALRALPAVGPARA